MKNFFKFCQIGQLLKQDLLQNSSPTFNFYGLFLSKEKNFFSSFVLQSTKQVSCRNVQYTVLFLKMRKKSMLKLHAYCNTDMDSKTAFMSWVMFKVNHKSHKLIPKLFY